MKLRLPDPIELLIWVIVLAGCSMIVLSVVRAWGAWLS